MKLAYLYMAIFVNFSLTSNHLHPLQVENCDSNSRLVVDEDDNGRFRLERVKLLSMTIAGFNPFDISRLIPRLLGKKCELKHQNLQMLCLNSVERSDVTGNHFD